VCCGNPFFLFIQKKFCILRFFIFFFLLSLFSVSSQCAGSEVKPRTLDRGCDSVPLGQSNRTPHGAVIDEYGANGGMITVFYAITKYDRAPK
jgi:hypothetical protein